MASELEIEELDEIDSSEVFEDDEDLDEEDEDDDNSIIELTVPQTQFTLSEVKYPLFLAGFGSGKSLCMTVNILNDLSYPGANIAAYAPTYDLLDLITAPYLEEILTLNDIPYEYNKNRKIIKVEGHGDIILRSLSNPEKIVGYQVFRSHIDELDTLQKEKAKKAWQKIIARNRQKVYVRNEETGKRVPIGRKLNGKLKYKTELNRVSAYTTPEGFSFCYETWEKGTAEEKQKKIEAGYVIYRASTYSNIDNLPEDYIETLKKSYPAELVDAYIEGIFVNLIGGRVYPKFDRNYNGTNEEIRDGETLHVGMDFNVMFGASIIHVVRDGIPYALDEIHNAYDTWEQIKILKERYPRHAINVYPDQTGKNRHASNTTETDIQQLYSAGFNVYEEFTNPPIKDRVTSFNAMICNGKGERRYFVNERKCPEFVLCLEQQIWGDNGLPDKKMGLDHKPDAAGYFIYMKYPVVKPASTTSTLRT